MPIAQVQFTCKHISSLFAYDGAYQILINPTAGGSQLLGGISTNLYLFVSAMIVLMEVWLPFMMCRVSTLRPFLSGYSFLFMIIYANCGAIAVIASSRMGQEIQELHDSHVGCLQSWSSGMACPILP